ncbi:hypothetical protein SAMN05216330_11915 [Bradyrhizobium sp. Ghvi]|nr:hypothetical protein SAMN05216330_11915 [Bradyrhizobium sp. Ghvi]
MLDQAMQLQFPHWLMIAGMFLVIIGTIGMLTKKTLPRSRPTMTNS